MASYADDLARRGCLVTLADSGVECWEKLSAFCPEVLVLDPALPWGGGDGVLAVMHEDQRCAAAVIVLARAQDCEALYRIAAFTVDDCQTKPVSPARLWASVAAVLARRTAQEAYHAV
jgi:DNA-binding response OmpR family regulator